MTEQLATLGGGCFWCTEAVFEQVAGVQKIVSGYANGYVVNPTYEEVCQKTTGHAEVVQITFDPAVVSYARLVEIHLATHDPTTPDQQGNDVGPQYRSAIYTHTDDQLAIATAIVAEFTAKGIYPDPIVTEVAPLTRFYPAEDYHQRYYQNHPNQGYCQFVVAPKVAKVRKLLGLTGG